MNKALRIFAYIWFSLAIALNVVAIIGMFLVAPTFWDGFDRVQEVYSPFNILNIAVLIATLSPGIVAFAVADKFSDKGQK